MRCAGVTGVFRLLTGGRRAGVGKKPPGAHRPAAGHPGETAGPAGASVVDGAESNRTEHIGTGTGTRTGHTRAQEAMR